MTAPVAVRSPPRVRLPLLPTVVLTVRVVLLVFVSALLGLIVSCSIVVLLSSVTLPLLVLPIVTSSVVIGALFSDHFAVSVVQLPVASIADFPRRWWDHLELICFRPRCCIAPRSSVRRRD